MHLRTLASALLALSSLAARALGQTFPETEPNSAKPEATAVNGIVSGDTLGGTTTGTTATAGSTALTTLDTFRVKTSALPLGIYRHTLTLTSATVGHTGTIRGLSQAAGVIDTTSDVAFQTSSTGTTPPRTNTWYGFGRQEEVYYRVTGTSATTAAYTASFATATVAPTAIAGPFFAGPITIASAVGQTTDTEIYVYDSNLDPVPLGHNDDPASSTGTGPSSITITLAAGTYYVAISNYNTANNQSDANPTEFYQSENVLEFPNALACSSTTLVACWYTVSDGTTTTTVPAVKTLFHQILWGTFTVNSAVLPPPNDSCANALSLNATSLVGTVNLATNDGGASCDPSGATGRDVWYSFTAPAAGTLALDTCGSAGIDTVLSVHAACSGGELACNDDCGGSPCGATGSCVSVALSSGQTVLVRVGDKGLGGTTFNIHRTFTLQNDGCSTPTLLAAPGSYPVDTTWATTGAQGQGETLCTLLGFTAIHKDLWYAYTAQQAGTITVTTCQLLNPAPQDDSKIAVYAASSCPTSGSAIACNDDDPACPSPSGFASRVSFASTCGTTYLIQIGYYGGNPAGSIVGQFSLTETGTACATPSTVFCDGSLAGACAGCVPNNTGAANRGCANSGFAAGTELVTSGVASLAADTLVLTANDMPGPGLFFQANGLGSVNPFGDGMLCAAVGILRLGVVFPTPTFSASYPGGLTPNPISVAGAPISAGDTKHYQVWYRDAIAFCSASTFNTSNGRTLVFGP